MFSVWACRDSAADLNLLAPHVGHIVGFITQIVQDQNLNDASIRAALGLVGSVHLVWCVFPDRQRSLWHVWLALCAVPAAADDGSSLASWSGALAIAVVISQASSRKSEPPKISSSGAARRSRRSSLNICPCSCLTLAGPSSTSALIVPCPFARLCVPSPSSVP